MLKPVNRIKERLTDSTRSFKERVFILLTLVTDFVAVLALVGDIALGENIVEIIALAITIILVPIVTLVSVRLKKVSAAAMIVVFGLVFVLLPILFYFGGGVEGGGVLWIIFSYLYAGLVLTGKWKVFFLIVLSIESCGFYLHAYFNPYLIKQHSRREFYTESLISIIMVGVICCMMVWFEEWMYAEENKRAKEETDKVDEMRRAQSRFFSSMSHEIRTPINSILGLNEIILRQEDASEEIVKDAENIQGAGRMLLALVNDILDLSKIEADKMEIVPVSYNLGNVISEIVSMIWLLAEQKGLELKVEVDPDTPSALFGDEVRIKQILVNLLNNAIKYTKEGTVTLHIQTEETTSERTHLLFSVTDTGMGIKQDAIPYLFDAFKRTDEEKNTGIEGTGLGLSIVKQLVELMGGEITVNSVYTQGSSFVVSLWQEVTSEEKIGDININSYGSRRSVSGYVPAFTAPDARILIVDDNRMNLDVESKLLTETEINIDTAVSGEEALAKTLNEQYDLIFMDHLMPEMDGIECLQNIRRQIGGLNTRVPVIALTANAGGENRELYEKSGFDGYLVKPVTGQRMEECLLSHLPETKVFKNEGADELIARMNTSDTYSKKLSVVVATNSMCDLPESVIKNCGIDVIPFRLSSDGKTYFDRVEANTDELVRYVREGDEFDISPPSVKDFEEFFAREIKKAHHVIYISLAGSVSHEYTNALEAAREYGNVTIFQSGLNSSAMGMLSLYAYKLSTQGRTTKQIINALEIMRRSLRCTFMTDDVIFFSRRRMFSKGIYSFLHLFSFKPVISLNDNKLAVKRFFVGELSACHERYISVALPKRANPDLDVCFVSYASLSEEERERIEKAIRKHHNFNRIVFQKISGANALSCGTEAYGISYMKKNSLTPGLSSLLVTEAAPRLGMMDTEPSEPVHDQSLKKEEKKKEKKWYEDIPEIDSQVALEYCRSEDDLKGVLKTYCASINSRADEIERYYKAEDWENYIIKVHAMKSSSKLVGAMQLSEDARVLEFAGKEKNIELIKERTDKLLDEMRRFKTVLEPYVTDEAPQTETTDFDRDSVSELLNQLEEAMNELDLDIADSVIDKLAGYVGPEEYAVKLELIKAAVINVDDEEAIKLIEEMRKML